MDHKKRANCVGWHRRSPVREMFEKSAILISYSALLFFSVTSESSSLLLCNEWEKRVQIVCYFFIPRYFRFGMTIAHISFFTELLMCLCSKYRSSHSRMLKIGKALDVLWCFEEITRKERYTRYILCYFFTFFIYFTTRLNCELLSNLTVYIFLVPLINNYNKH